MAFGRLRSARVRPSPVGHGAPERHQKNPNCQESQNKIKTTQTLLFLIPQSSAANLRYARRVRI